jgi:ubiquinone/menaquinone biosynthesis C-methylase UbiE
MLEIKYMVGKWLYGFKAIRDTVNLCNISKDMKVLIEGAGLGKTPCYVVKKFGCKVIATEILEGAVFISRADVQKKGISDKVSVELVKTENLPYDDNSFDAVIIESILSFVKDKERAVRECYRVLKQGKRFSALEMNYKKKPSFKLLQKMNTTFGLKADPLSHKEWNNLFSNLGFKQLISNSYDLNLFGKGFEDIFYERMDGVKEFGNMIYTNVTNPVARPITIDFLNLYFESKYLGYGIYSGIKK